MNHKEKINTSWIGSRIVIGLLATLLFSGIVSAQQAAQPVPLGSQDNSVSDTATQNAVVPQGTATSDSDANAAPVQSAQGPSVPSLESGLPLRAVMSPLHWGHLSLLAASLVGAYDSNFAMTQPAVSGQETFLSGLVVYSIPRHHSQFDLQYMPTVWAANGRVGSDFTSQSADAQYFTNLGRYWTLGLHDQFRYSPNQFYWSNSTFTPDFTSGTATSNPLFLIGQKSLLNNFGVDIGHQLNAHNQLSFDANENFVRLSQNTTTNSISSQLPTHDEQLGTTAQVTWNHILSPQSTLGLTYGYQHQYDRFSHQSNDFHNAGVMYTRKLRPSVGLSLEAGPSWAQHGGNTVQASASLFKSFHNGGIGVSASRGTSFTGLISNSYNNRYDVSFTHLFLRRVDFQVSYSYVQQSFLNARQTDGGTVYASAGYQLTRNWSVYSSYYYLNYNNPLTISGRRQVMSAGIRWAWQPASTSNR